MTMTFYYYICNWLVLVLLPEDSGRMPKRVGEGAVILILILIYLLTAIGLSPGGSSTVHIYTQTIHRMIQNKQYIERYKTNNT